MSTPEQPLIASPSQTVGPFFHVGPGGTDRFGRVVANQASGERIQLRLRVLDGDGVPLPDALIELIHPGTSFGRLGTNEDGWCVFDAVRPPAAAAANGDVEAEHFNVCLHARGLLRHLYTRIYFEGDPSLAADPLLSIVPVGRRQTLVAYRIGQASWELVIRLQGENETVFFDV